MNIKKRIILCWFQISWFLLSKTRIKCYAKNLEKRAGTKILKMCTVLPKKNLRHFFKVAPRNLKSAKNPAFFVIHLDFWGKNILSYFSQDSNCKHLRRSSWETSLYNHNTSLLLSFVKEKRERVEHKYPIHM